MSASNTLMYAELLPNIRQITIIAALTTPCDLTTKAELSANGQQITLQHGREMTILNLPGQVAPHAQLQKPALGSKELSWRLPLAGLPKRVNAEDAQSNETPWSAKKLGEDTEFLCRECRAIIIGKGIIKTWKDLPSENWAEMMDFWHCHKPSDDVEKGANGHGYHDQDVVAATKGYGANTRFGAQPGVGFVDLTTFLLASRDCTNVELLEDGGYQEGGQALLLLVDGLATDTNTQDEHPVTNLLQQQLIMSTLFSGIWVTCLTGGYNPRHFTPYLPQDHGRPWD